MGYSISYRRGQDGKYHPHVRIERSRLTMLKQHLRQLALHPSTDRIARELAACRSSLARLSGGSSSNCSVS